MERERNCFDIDFKGRRVTVRSDSPVAGEWADKDIVLHFQTNYPEYRLGLIALVARQYRQGQDLNELVLFDDISQKIEVLNWCPILKGKPDRVSKGPAASIYRYFRKGIKLENQELMISLDGAIRKLKDIPKAIRSSLESIVCSQGTPPNTVRFDMRGLHSLGLKPADISERTFNNLEECIEDIEKRLQDSKVGETLTPTERSILASCKALGIARVSEDGKASPELHFGGANEIRILALSAQHFIRSCEKQLGTAVSRGRRIRVILPDPKCEMLEVSIRLLFPNERPERAVSDIQDSEERLRRILERYQPQQVGPGQGGIYLGHFQTEFRCFLTICDDTWGWLTLHLPQMESVATPSFELVKGKLLNDCIAYFDRVWTFLEEGCRTKKLNADAVG